MTAYISTPMFYQGNFAGLHTHAVYGEVLTSVVIQPVPHGQLLLSELFHPLAVNVGLHGSGVTGQGGLPEGLGHTMKEPGGGEHHRGLAHGVPAVQEKLSVLVALRSRLREPV